MAWRWIGARYLLVDSDLAPDLEDLQSDRRRKVTGQPYAEAARSAMTRLIPDAPVKGNKLAPSQERGLDFASVARRWRVSDDLIGATLGPGARRWVEASATQIVGKRFRNDTYYRVAMQYAAWVREA